MVEDKREDGVQLIDHVLDMVEIGGKFVGVICGSVGIFSLRGQIAEAISVTIRYFLFLSDFLLPDHGVEQIELENFFKSGTIQTILYFLDLDLDLDLGMVRQLFNAPSGWFTYIYLYHAINDGGEDSVC